MSTAIPIPSTRLEVSGTSLQGYVNCAFDKIVQVFGKPNVKGDGYKTDAEWVLATPAGVATLYNYKTGKNYLGKFGLKTENIKDWHIGGHNKKVVKYVQDALL